LFSGRNPLWARAVEHLESAVPAEFEQVIERVPVDMADPHRSHNARAAAAI